MPEIRAHGRRPWKEWSWLGLVPAALGFIFMSVISWRKWPDPLIDFGGQLYIPWQLSEGQTLYRDVMYLPGPVSQYYHALLFRLFSISFTTLIVSNLLILVGFVVLVYRLFYRCADRLTAMFAALAVVVAFGFSEYLDVGNYNYIAPYSHEIWHGIVLTSVLIACLSNWFAFPKKRWALLGGICFGITCLEKPENGVAAAAVVGVAALLALSRKHSFLSSGPRRLVRSLGLFLLGTFLPVVVMFFVFFRTEDSIAGLKGVFGGWTPLLTTQMSKGTFFRTGMGLDAPWYHLQWMLLHFLALTAVTVVCAWRFRSEQNRIERTVLLAMLAGFALNFDWTHCGRSLPLVLGCGLALLFYRIKRSAAGDRPAFLIPLLWMTFALFLLLKMGVYPRIFHYGVFLAMPAFLGAIYFFLWLLPSSFPQSIHAPTFRLAMVTLLLVGLVRLTIHSSLFYADKTAALGENGDRILTFDAKKSAEGSDIAKAVAWLRNNTPATATIAALPEGAMINYQTRRRNPTPYIVFMSEIYAFGEEKMTAPYRRTPPDYILLVHRETAEYGLKFFGQQQGYGKDMLQWIYANYVPIEVIGAEPLKNDKFGIKIFKRK